MRYRDGKNVCLGDQLLLKNGTKGRVVCLIGENEYSAGYQSKDWSYLEQGALILFEDPGIAHFLELDDQIMLISRK